MRKVKAAEVSRDGVEKVRERRREQWAKHHPKMPRQYAAPTLKVPPNPRKRRLSKRRVAEALKVYVHAPVDDFIICRKCFTYKSGDQFPQRGDANGPARLKHQCVDCYNKQRRQKWESVKTAAGEEYLSMLAAKAEKSREWRHRNRQKHLESRRKWAERIHSDPELREEFLQKKRDQIKTEKYKTRIKNKRKNDIHFRLSSQLRKRLLKALKGNAKRGSAIKDLGCSINFLKDYLESQFYDCPRTGAKMTWENHGRTGWHIDHILEFKNVDLNDPEQFKKVVHYTNLRPLWYFENLARNRKS